MRTADFDFDLPEHLIAQTPLTDRTASRLMVLDRAKGTIDHQHFYNLLDHLNPGDCLVLNNTRVLPARLIGERVGTGGRIEILLLKAVGKDCWEVLVKPGKRAKIGAEITFGDNLLKGTVVDIGEEGSRIIEFQYQGIFEQVLDQLGEMPLPPYITATLEDKERYQTVYARHQGSAAAPTAGLHFNQGLLKAIGEKGVHIAYITLHVGLGTFRPVKVDNLLEHKMHSEFYEIDEVNSGLINRTKAGGGRIICVGTTCLRTLETVAGKYGEIRPDSGWTDIFIYPGYEIMAVDCLITNFHLPQSTLIMLVAALTGKSQIMNAYQTAVAQEYRFFSFGDAMLIK